MFWGSVGSGKDKYKHVIHTTYLSQLHTFNVQTLAGSVLPPRGIVALPTTTTTIATSSNLRSAASEKFLGNGRYPLATGPNVQP